VLSFLSNENCFVGYSRGPCRPHVVRGLRFEHHCCIMMMHSNDNIEWKRRKPWTETPNLKHKSEHRRIMGSTSVCPWLRPGAMLPAYWPVYKFDLILPVIFPAAFNVLTTITAYHLPLYQCVAIAFRILVLSVRFIVPSVVQCYLMHWLNILSIAWSMMRVQRGFVLNIAWNLWGLL